MKRVEWPENRQGELHFVIADLGDAGWMFSERSTYEMAWHSIPATPALIAQANRLSSEPEREAGAGGATSVSNAVELGDYSDNAAVFSIAMWKIRIGAVQEGVPMLSALRHHILKTHDVKSTAWLLERVESALEDVARSQAIRDSHSPAPSNQPVMARQPQMSKHDRSNSFKVRLIDAAAVLSALLWIHGLIVRELLEVTGVDLNTISANIAAGSALMLALRFVPRR